MNPINKKALALTETTEKDFLEYCAILKKSITSTKTRKDYFRKIIDNEIVRDNNTKKIKVLKEK